MPSSRRVAIVGGGITGLAAAYHLERLTDAEIDLYEASDHLGGKLQTDRFRNWLLEEGPDCFFTRKPGTMELIRELGIEDEVIHPIRLSFSLCIGGVLHRYPRKLVASYFTDPEVINALPFLSKEAKDRARAECETPAGDGADESIRSFFSRRFGAEFSRLVAEPVLGGTHGGTSNALSMKALYPQFLELERRFGSLSDATTARQPEVSTAFRSFRRGMHTLVEALSGTLSRTRIHLGHAVASLGTLSADKVVLAVPANHADSIVGGDVGVQLAKLPHRSSTIVTFAFARSDISHKLDGTGFLVPDGEPMQIGGMTWSSEKWEGRAPRAEVLLRVFIPRSCENLEEAQRTALDEIKPLLGIKGEPLMSTATWWTDAQPQYQVGHLDLIDEIESSLPENVYLVGTSYRGVGIPDCLNQARAAAEKISKSL